MFKKSLILIFVTAIIILFFYSRENIDYSDYSFVISTDDFANKGKTNEILVTILEKNNENKYGLAKKVPPVQAYAIYEDFQNKQIKKLLQVDYINDCQFLIKTFIDDSIKSDDIKIELVKSGNIKEILAQTSIQLSPQNSMLVTIPESLPIAGQEIKFNIFTFNTQNLLPVGKKNVRAQMYSKDDVLLINDLLTTDINGQATYTLKLNEQITCDEYSIVFSQSNMKQSFSFIPVKPDNKNIFVNYKFTSEANNDSMFKNVQAVSNPNKLYFTYNCKEADIKMFELRQNGSFIHSESLKKSAGLTVIKLREPVNLKLPLMLRLWQINGNGLFYSDETVLQPQKSSNKLSELILQSAQKLSRHNHIDYSKELFINKGNVSLNSKKAVQKGKINSEINIELFSNKKNNLSSQSELLNISQIEEFSKEFSESAENSNEDELQNIKKQAESLIPIIYNELKYNKNISDENKKKLFSSARYLSNLVHIPFEITSQTDY